MDSIVEITPEGHSVRVTTQAHIDELDGNLREMDKIELACFNTTPTEALSHALENDDVTLTVMTKDEKVMAIFGSGNPEDPYIWMLGTSEVETYSRDFLRHCRKWVWSLAEMYGSVSNYIHTENFICLKWLEWCGAVLGEPFTMGGEPVQKFTITR